jgi:hypothetical protein
MVEQAITWVVWVVQKIWPGLLVALVLKLISHTGFYEKHLANPVAVIMRCLLGPRLQIHPLDREEGGFSHARFSILKVEITNQPNVTHIPLLNWKLPDSLRE